MRLFTLTVAVATLGSTGALAAAPKDLPANHWARPAVLAVLSRNVMTAPGGKFNGSNSVTRTELAADLAGYAKTLEKRQWPAEGAKPVGDVPAGARYADKPVTRYELAALLDRVARYVMNGLPKETGTIYGKSEALPPAVKLKGIAPSNPAYPSLKYLAERRMLSPNSVLLKPGPQPVTAKQLTDALTILIAGLNDRYTDEPQNK